MKQEYKNVVRKIKQDSAFVSRIRTQERAERDLQQQRKIADAMAFLQEQQATFKQMVKQGMTHGGGSGGGGKKAKRRY